MSTYAIGDVHGCYSSLQQLLKTIQFNPKYDRLWFTGDLVNRGPQSLEVLRFVKQLGKNQCTTLGNHDLHLLAIAHGVSAPKPEDALTDILKAPDSDDLIYWLSHQPLLHHDATLNFTMVHAGLAPAWDLKTAMQLAREVETEIQNANAKTFFQHMYGNEPEQWDAKLQGWDRLRCITNYFTRVRFCHPDGRIVLTHQSKGTLDSSPLTPWFQLSNRQSVNLNIIFGHWAALRGVTHTPHVFALDTGCVWGHCLTALRLEDQQRFSVDC